MARAKRTPTTGATVVIGNPKAIITAATPDGGVEYKRARGVKETTIVFAPELTVNEMLREAIGVMGVHMEAGTKPKWIKTEHAELKAALLSFYEMQDNDDKDEDGTD